MTRSISLAALVLMLAALWQPSPGTAADQPAKKSKDRAADLFGPDKVWQVHLTIPARNWEVLQPKKAPFFFGGKPADKDKNPAQQRGAFGYDFEYMPGDLEFAGKTYKDVGVRFKGNSTYMMSAGGLKRPFKIDLDRFTDDHDFHGLKMLNLANNASDQSQLREAVAYSVFRAAGIPAPRTAFVELSLTVPGKYDKEFVGLYTLIENIDRPFLNRHFAKHKGMLVKPEGLQGLSYLGTDWQPYEDRYRPKKETDAQQQNRLRDFTRLVNFADDETFRAQIDQTLDVDLFLRYLACCAAMTNLDSFIGTGHNYYLYLNPQDNRFVMLPWDLNNSLGNFSMMGSLEQQTEWTVKKPYLGNNKLAARVLAMPQHEATYRKHLRELTTQGFKPETLHTAIDQLQKTIQPSLDREAKNKRNDGGIGAFALMLGGAPPDLKKFISNRATAVVAQLDGKAEGKELRGGFGGGRPPNPMNPAPAVAPLHPLTKTIFTAADADKDGKLSLAEAKTALVRLFAECNMAKKDTLDEKTFADGLTKLLPKPAAFGFRPPGGSGNSQAIQLAGLIYYRSGATKDDALAEKEFVAFVEKLFRASDRNGDGGLDERELSDGLQLLSPAPPGFGPPPAPPKAQASNGQP